MPKLQQDFVSTVRQVLPAGATLGEEQAPDWLIRPGRSECDALWPLVQSVYRDLTGSELPDEMPPRERRRLDAIITDPDGRQRALELDETQHFTAARATTLRHYADLTVAFDVGDWLRRSDERTGREPSGGFARPCPPLFGGPGGRHRQRAFRDFLADALPLMHGWLPTMRISDIEARAALASDDPSSTVGQLLAAKSSR